MQNHHRRPNSTATALLFQTGARRFLVPNPAFGRPGASADTKPFLKPRGPKMPHRHITHEIKVGDGRGGEVSIAYHATKGFRAIRVPA